MSQRRLPGWITAPIALGAFGLLVWLERRRPLRRSVEPANRHDARNLAVGAAGALAVRLVEAPVVEPLAALVERRGWGLLKLVRLPAWLEVALAVVAMDYTLYVWHVLTHKVPFLWRLHALHHADLDLTATTAVRFHFVELAISTPWRAAQVAAIGVSPRALSVWQTLLFVSILFHHSNLRLPADVEARLARLLVTPRLHGIHHSEVQDEMDSNWASVLTVWDRLHGTYRDDVRQERIRIGVQGYEEPLGLADLLALPAEPPR
jgi:sterol desaturase/sphingolipid hydroxylase (fatty acid hydroxylase superfamily)